MGGVKRALTCCACMQKGRSPTWKGKISASSHHLPHTEHMADGGEKGAEREGEREALGEREGCR